MLKYKINITKSSHNWFEFGFEKHLKNFDEINNIGFY